MMSMFMCLPILVSNHLLSMSPKTIWTLTPFSPFITKNCCVWNVCHVLFWHSWAFLIYVIFWHLSIMLALGAFLIYVFVCHVWTFRWSPFSVWMIQICFLVREADSSSGFWVIISIISILFSAMPIRMTN
jgi:hypothetical protein